MGCIAMMAFGDSDWWNCKLSLPQIANFFVPEVRRQASPAFFTTHNAWLMDLGLLRREEIGLTEKDHASRRVLLSGTERLVHPQVSGGQVWRDSSKCRGLMARREGFREEYALVVEGHTERYILRIFVLNTSHSVFISLWKESQDSRINTPKNRMNEKTLTITGMFLIATQRRINWGCIKKWFRKPGKTTMILRIYFRALNYDFCCITNAQRSRLKIVSRWKVHCRNWIIAKNRNIWKLFADPCGKNSRPPWKTAKAYNR